MGKIISVTIPLPLVEELQKEADVLGISRSRFISNILLKWQESRKKPIENLEHPGSESSPNKCVNREDDGLCTVFDMVCNAGQKQAESCSGYPNKEEE